MHTHAHAHTNTNTEILKTVVSIFNPLISFIAIVVAS